MVEQLFRASKRAFSTTGGREIYKAFKSRPLIGRKERNWLDSVDNSILVILYNVLFYFKDTSISRGDLFVVELF